MPDLVNSRTWRERVGGRWAVSLLTFAITTALGLFALLAGEAATIRSPADIGSWLLVWCFAVCGLGVFVWLGNFTFLRNRRITPVPVVLVFIFDALCGAIFGLLVSAGATYLGLPTAQGTFERTLADTVTALWWGPTLSYFLDYRQQMAEARRELIATAVELELARLQSGEIVELIDEELREEIGAELLPARARVAELLAGEPHRQSATALSESEWSSVSALLRGTADESVRPLSRRLWSQREERYPKLPWWKFLANIPRYQPFRPLAYALIDVIGTLAALMGTFGFERAVVLLVSGLAITLSAGLIGNALMRRFPQHHVAIFLVMIMVMQMSVLVRALLRSMWIPGSSSATWVITQVVAGVVVVFITSGFGAWRDKATELRMNLRSDLRTDRIVSIARSQQVALFAREAAQVLHGSVQTRLVACALAIEQAAVRDDARAINLALVDAHDALSASVALRREEGLGSIAAEVARKTSLWDGFCTFDIAIDPKAAGDPTIIGRVVEEAISNAIRHGQSTHIAITISGPVGGGVEVVVDDNGRGPQRGAGGMGSAYVAQVSRGDWSLTATDTGSRLKVAIPSN
ncbi:unannotated protein [freshwater metagenome]|uniref:Unannotated protein n=1 Tax=freshwater metagenome TaxID=449393 RepID=A0A6J7GUG0_9ZZZZ|nr:hypothetical protein [Actinomycetota bacterium]